MSSNRDEMRDVFLIGAGFSRAISLRMPLLNDLSIAVRRRHVQGLHESGLCNLFPNNIEMWLTYLSQDHPWLSESENMRNHAMFLDLLQVVRAVLTDRVAEAMEKPCPGWLYDLVKYWHDNQSSILTLNYDVLIEAAMCSLLPDETCTRHLYPVALTRSGDRTEGPFFEPERKSTLKLYKLHGSTNWFYSGRQSFFGETIYFSSVADRWPCKTDDLEDVRVDLEAVADKAPFIVPPVLGKDSYFQHETLRNLWLRAGNLIQCARRIFCLGYSLPATDTMMRFFLNNNVPVPPVDFYVVDINDKAPRHFKSRLSDNYTIQGFTGENAIPGFVSALRHGTIPNGADNAAAVARGPRLVVDTRRH